jgi:hypothetical protein
MVPTYLTGMPPGFLCETRDRQLKVVRVQERIPEGRPIHHEDGWAELLPRNSQRYGQTTSPLI